MTLFICLVAAMVMAQVQGPAAQTGPQWWMILIALAVVGLIVTLIRRTGRMRTR